MHFAALHMSVREDGMVFDVVARTSWLPPPKIPRDNRAIDVKAGGVYLLRRKRARRLK